MINDNIIGLAITCAKNTNEYLIFIDMNDGRPACAGREYLAGALGGPRGPRSAGSCTARQMGIWQGPAGVGVRKETLPEL